MLKATYSNPMQRHAMRRLADKRLFSNKKKEAADISVGAYVGAIVGEEVVKICETVTLR
jgi:hypothetical protein